MRKIFLAAVFILSFLFIFKGEIYSQNRYAACDLCGYCPPNTLPTNWEKCRQCIYPESLPDPNTKSTLKIDPTVNAPPTPYPGRQYTMVGCIQSDLGSFKAEGAAASVVQVLLNIIFSIAGGVGLLYLIYGAFLILTSQADPERLNQGKRVIYGAIIGVVFSFSAVFLVNLLATGILKIPGFGGTP